MPLRRAALALAGLALLGGCMTPSYNDPARIGPFFTPDNHVGETSLGGVRRVVLLPIWGGTLAPVESAAALDPVFTMALQQTQRFEVVTLSRDEMRQRFRAEALSASGALPHDLLTKLKRDFAADAVLMVDLTVFHAYRPLSLGLRAKLATLENTRLVWRFECVFAADDPAVANTARAYFLDSDKRGVPGDLTPAALQSPSRFAAYAAAAMFATLPPVILPPAPGNVTLPQSTR